MFDLFNYEKTKKRYARRKLARKRHGRLNIIITTILLRCANVLYYIYIYIYKQTYIDMYVYIYIYTHTYIYIYSQMREYR